MLHLRNINVNPFSTQHPRIDQKMAHHISLRLPGIKLRKCSTRGPSQREVIHPNYGLSQPQDVDESEKSESDDALLGCGIDPEMDPGCDTTLFGDIETLVCIRFNKILQHLGGKRYDQVF